MSYFMQLYFIILYAIHCRMLVVVIIAWYQSNCSHDNSVSGHVVS